MNITLSLSLVSSLAYLFDFIFLVVLHFLPTGYDPVRYAVSDYAIGKYRRLFQIRLWCSAVGALALAGALYVVPGTPPLATLDLIFLLLLAPTRLGTSLFHTDLESKARTRNGTLHYVFAILSFALAFTVVHDTTAVLQTLAIWREVKGALAFLALLALLTLIAVVVTLLPPLRRIFGLFERIFLLTITIWFLLVSIFLLVKVL